MVFYYFVPSRTPPLHLYYVSLSYNFRLAHGTHLHKRHQSTASYIFYIMETSSGQYKVYTAKRLLQSRAVHWLIGEKLKKKGSKSILRLCFYPRLAISKSKVMVSKARLVFRNSTFVISSCCRCVHRHNH